MSSADLVMEGAKCKELRKVIIGSGGEVFPGRRSITSPKEGSANRVSHEEC